MDKLTVDFSPIESEVLKLKVGRCNTEKADGPALLQILLEGRYDLCRLKVPAQDEYVTANLEREGLPVFFSGGIRRYSTPVTPEQHAGFLNEGLIFEMYDGTQDALLRKMLDGTWGTYPIGYYRSPMIGPMVTKEMEMECVFRFYKKFNLNRDFPDNSILFIRHGDDYVGFFALNVIDDRLESHIGGILPPFQKGGYFLDMLNYITGFCLEHSLKYFCFGARNENAQVQKIFQKFGFLAYGNEYVYHIPCFFGTGGEALETLELSHTGESGKFEELLYTSVKKHFKDRYEGRGRTSFNYRRLTESPSNETVMVRIYRPLDNGAEQLLSFKIEDARGTVIGFGTMSSG